MIKKAKINTDEILKSLTEGETMENISVRTPPPTAPTPPELLEIECHNCGVNMIDTGITVIKVLDIVGWRKEQHSVFISGSDVQTEYEDTWDQSDDVEGQEIDSIYCTECESELEDDQITTLEEHGL